MNLIRSIAFILAAMFVPTTFATDKPKHDVKETVVDRTCKHCARDARAFAAVATVFSVLVIWQNERKDRKVTVAPTADGGARTQVEFRY